MARFDMTDPELAIMGQQELSGDVFFQLGIMYSVGRNVDSDMVAAHKWFNLAVMHGNCDAAQYRKEVAEELSSNEISLAQQAAREWLKTH